VVYKWWIANVGSYIAQAITQYHIRSETRDRLLIMWHSITTNNVGSNDVCNLFNSKCRI